MVLAGMTGTDGLEVIASGEADDAAALAHQFIEDEPAPVHQLLAVPGSKGTLDQRRFLWPGNGNSGPNFPVRPSGRVCPIGNGRFEEKPVTWKLYCPWLVKA
jgi:hypothetical protein